MSLRYIFLLRNYVYIYEVKIKHNKTVEKLKKINNNNNNHNKIDKTLTQCMDYPHGLHRRSMGLGNWVMNQVIGSLYWGKLT